MLNSPTDEIYQPLVFSKANHKAKTEAATDFWELAEQFSGLSPCEVIESMMAATLGYAETHKIELPDPDSI